MDDITPENQQKVTQYMQAVNEQDLANAIAIMKNHQFNLQSAIKHKQDPSSQALPNRPAPSRAIDEQIVMRYIKFGQKKQAQLHAVRVLFDIFSELVVDFFRYLGSFLPAFLYVLLFGSPFQRLYRSSTTNRYTPRPLKYCLPKTKNINVNSILLLISPRQPHPDVSAFLNDSAIQSRIRQYYFMCCYLVGNREMEGIEGADESPQVVVLRWNIFQQLVEIGREKDLSKVTVEKLARWWHQGRNLYRRDQNVLVKCQNFIARESGIAMEIEETPEIRIVQRKPKDTEGENENTEEQAEDKPEGLEEPSEEDKLLSKEEQERKNQQIQEKRKLLKMSFPDEPTDGDLVRISFRCPNGSTILRNFRSDQKIQLVFKWVQLNYQIKFEKASRNFQILYCANALSSKKDQMLSEVFQSEQEKVLIRQL